jgi:hypothetical protein
MYFGGYLCPDCSNARTEIDRLKAEAKRLTTIIEQDRTLVAQGLNVIKDAIRGHSWLRESRGSYSWDDDRWMAEFGMAIDDIEKDFPLLESVASNLNDSPIGEDILEARKPLAAVDRLKAENAKWRDKFDKEFWKNDLIVKENAKYKEALEWYGDEENYSSLTQNGSPQCQPVIRDGGQRARKATK